MNTNEIPQAIQLSADDPFIKYLGFVHNSGVNYMTRAVNILNELQTYKTNLDGYMKYTKLAFMLGNHDGNDLDKSVKP